MAPALKLKAELWETQFIPQLKSIVSVYSRQVKMMAIKFTENHLYLISENEVMSSTSKVWTEIPVRNFFESYELQGVEGHNSLVIRLSSENLSDSLKSMVQGIKLLRLKLRSNEKHAMRPDLCFEYEIGTFGPSRLTKKSIEVELVHPRFWDRYDEPTLPPFDICCILPDLSQLKSFVDKCKNISSRLEIAIDKEGKMNLTVQKEGLFIERRFSDIQMQDNDARLSDDALVAVDIKKLNNFFKTVPSNANLQIFLKIVKERCAHFAFLADQISVQFTLPNQLR
ncbi:hus1-like checkpoint clamp component [Brevipalpus obovatus]|uniref:hus1-like checkpoint clamp component n=1 Tax=Brevipalpus obovatus TaxID=246614 RepID=UPI003D9F4C19